MSDLRIKFFLYAFSTAVKILVQENISTAVLNLVLYVSYSYKCKFSISNTLG
jgi:hypothetical protein